MKINSVESTGGIGYIIPRPNPEPETVFRCSVSLRKDEFIKNENKQEIRKSLFKWW